MEVGWGSRGALHEVREGGGGRVGLMRCVG